MNAKERMIAALNLESPVEVPAAPCYSSLYLESYTHRYYVEQYKRAMKDKERLDVDHGLDTERRAEALYQSYGIFEHRQDWMEVYCGPSRRWAAERAMEWEGSELVYVDKLTGARISTEQESRRSTALSYMTRDNYTEDTWDLSGDFGTVEQIDELLPVVKVEELLEWGVFDLPKKVVEDYGGRFFISAIGDAPYISTYELLGFQGMMLMMYDRPEVFHHLMERRLEQMLEILKGYAMAGVHGIFLQDCLSSADLISPRQFDTFDFPGLRDIIAEIKALGMIPIIYYCGHVMPRLPRLKEAGAPCLAVEESKKDFLIDIEEVVQAVGDEMCVFGNIDTIGVVLEGTPGLIEREVARQLAAGARARSFVISTGSPFPLETNPRHIDALVEATRRLSPRYFS